MSDQVRAGEEPRRSAGRDPDKGDLVDPEPTQWIKKEATVGDLMDPEVIAVYADDAALVAVHELAPKNQHRVIVLAPENALVGIVSTMDVVRALDRGLPFSVGEAVTPPTVGTL